jgi:hypothetical protein
MINRCCICHKELDYKPIRLVKQLHDNQNTYGAYHNKHNYDFCKGCYRKFAIWVYKHREGSEVQEVVR